MRGKIGRGNVDEAVAKEGELEKKRLHTKHLASCPVPTTPVHAVRPAKNRLICVSWLFDQPRQPTVIYY